MSTLYCILLRPLTIAMALYLGRSTRHLDSQFAWLGIYLIPAIAIDLQRFDIGGGLDCEPVGLAVRLVRRSSSTAAHFERMRAVGMAVEIQFARLLMESTFCSSPIEYGKSDA